MTNNKSKKTAPKLTESEEDKSPCTCGDMYLAIHRCHGPYCPTRIAYEDDGELSAAERAALRGES